MRHQVFLLALLVVVGCNNPKKSDLIPQDNSSMNKVAKSGKDHPGKKILETECYICHNPQAPLESRIAPPMVTVKKQYIKETTSKEEFTEALIAWVNDPEQETKMPGSQQKYGKMPYIPYPDEALAQVAEYLYEYAVEKPKWLDVKHDLEKESDNNTKNQFQNRITEHTTRGMEYAKVAKQALGKNLLKAIQEKGPEAAVAFCNLKAGSITDSVSVMNNMKIRRVSDKPRNPDNAANEEELDYISYFKKLNAAGIEPKPIVKARNEEVDFYFPITTNMMCLQCHGTAKKHVQAGTLIKLRKLYPDDKAFDYQENEVRGLWALSFDADY